MSSSSTTRFSFGNVRRQADRELHMRYLRIVVLVTLAAALLVLPNAVRLSAADADHARDRDEIEALMWKYARALDTLNADAYVSCYTPDGEFRAGPTPTAG